MIKWSFDSNISEEMTDRRTNCKDNFMKETFLRQWAAIFVHPFVCYISFVYSLVPFDQRTQSHGLRFCPLWLPYRPPPSSPSLSRAWAGPTRGSPWPPPCCHSSPTNSKWRRLYECVLFKERACSSEKPWKAKKYFLSNWHQVPAWEVGDIKYRLGR